MLVDSHCHLGSDDFEEELDEIILRAKEEGVSTILNAGNDIGNLENQLKICEKYPFIFTAAGVHPHNAAEYENITSKDIISKTEHKKVVAIGECGLDYYYDYSPKETQIKVFLEHIKAAQETGLPLIIHNRDSDEDMMKILKEQYAVKPFTGELHCFSSSKELADFALSIGLYLSASGMITFNKCGELKEMFSQFPFDKIIVETDSPYLAPVPKRGKRNEPSYVKFVAEKLAQIRDISFEEAANTTTDNFFKLFRKASDKGRYDF
ncbi:MAG: TatD family hydrolase [Lactobacillaceae bacterium]|jgi:TatD DNase family protein|nr:TatD family hydrolase [Lactobacillaceae bacterium]